jgi:hypothetical protein
MAPTTSVIDKAIENTEDTPKVPDSNN